ncbi:MAG: transcription antitermination factor NusB [Candidatus Pacebacteria bacterium]|nr:transcription antitermination factor NusB [Candidatus Paceibacterota bacterium]
MAYRHLSRSIAMQSLYEWDFLRLKTDSLKEITDRNVKEFAPGMDDVDFAKKIVKGVIDHLSEIDKIIEKCAPQWPLPQINIIDRNVLRIGIYELLFSNKEEVPPKVAINEAIELAKNFSGETSGKFVNGVLGTIYKEVEEVESQTEKNQEILGGGAVFRKKDDKCQIALVLDVFNHWTFPKGHIEKGEKLEEAALREVKEETGLKNLKIIKNLGERTYKEGTRKVTDFLIQADEKEELECEKSSGIKDVKWFSLEEIPSLKQYKGVRKTMEEVIDYLKKK